jgi:thiol-disulfide isomerase/thioredoxin
VTSCEARENVALNERPAGESELSATETAPPSEKSPAEVPPEKPAEPSRAQADEEPVVVALTPSELGGRLEALTGAPAVINFWATWCKPCVDEFPELIEFYESEERGDAQFVSIVVMSDVEEDVKPFLEESGTPFEVIYLDANTPDDVTGVLPWETRWDGMLPGTFVLDGEGNLVEQWFQAVTLQDLNQAVEQARQT